MNHYVNFLLSVFFNLTISHSQELKKMQLTKEGKKKVVGNYMYSGFEESVIIFLYQNEDYAYKAFINIIGKQFKMGSWMKMILWKLEKNSIKQ